MAEPATRKHVLATDEEGETDELDDLHIPDISRLSLCTRITTKTEIIPHKYAYDSLSCTILAQNARYIAFLNLDDNNIYVGHKEHRNIGHMLQNSHGADDKHMPFVDIHTDVYGIDNILIHFVYDTKCISCFGIWRCHDGAILLPRTRLLLEDFPSNLSTAEEMAPNTDSRIPKCENTPKASSPDQDIGAHRPVFIVLTTHWVTAITTDTHLDVADKYVDTYRIFFYPWRIFSTPECGHKSIPKNMDCEILQDARYVRPFNQTVELGKINFATSSVESGAMDIVFIVSTSGVYLYNLTLPIQHIIPITHAFFAGVSCGNKRAFAHDQNNYDYSKTWRPMEPKYAKQRMSVIKLWNIYAQKPELEKRDIHSIGDTFPVLDTLLQIHLQQHKKRRLHHEDMRIRTISNNQQGDYIVCCPKFVVLLTYDRKTQTVHTKRVDIGMSAQGPQYGYITNTRVYVIYMNNGDILGGHINTITPFTHAVSEFMESSFVSMSGKNIRVSICSDHDNPDPYIVDGDEITNIQFSFVPKYISEIRCYHTHTSTIQELQ